MAELDQVLVRGPGVQAADVQVGFTQLLAATAAVAAAVGVWTGRRHLVDGGHIGLLEPSTTARSVDEQTTRRGYIRGRIDTDMTPNINE